MTKQEAIQKGWAKIWDIIEEQVKENILKDDGWSYEITESWLIAKGLELDFKGKYCRPKSLQGIETNRGWIKIESEDDLPKETGVFWCILNNEIVFLRYWSEAKLWEDLETENRSFPTCYQPIQKPQPPIY